MNNLRVGIDFNYNGLFVNDKGEYRSCPLYELGRECKVLEDVNMMAYVFCKQGTMGIFFQPTFYADEDMDLMGLEVGDYVQDDFVLYETDRGSYQTDDGRDISVSAEVVKALYELEPNEYTDDDRPRWVLKNEVRKKIADAIRDGFREYIKEHGYREERIRY